MTLDLEKAIPILERTPALLSLWLDGLDADWVHTNEGGETWSPYDVVGHLIHGEKTDWTQRLKIILGDAENPTFTPFDRFAQFEESKGKSLNDLLQEFTKLRAENVTFLRSLGLNEAQFSRTARHPSLGKVSLQELLATWVTHDLGHIGQIARVMAKQYKDEVGPWQEYLSILHR